MTASASTHANVSPTVLVCDDDMMVRLLARECLEADGMTVIEASNGLEAEALFFQEQPDIVLLDVNMPGKSGLEVCSIIRSHPSGRNTPILLATAADDKASIDRGFSAGATQYKTKPINWSLLSRDLRYMLRAADAFQTIEAQKDRLHYLAYFDHLTELPNRRSFTEQLRRNAILAEQTGALVGLLFIDIDHFKRINDSIGHEMGDQLIAAFGKQLQKTLEHIGPVDLYLDFDNPADQSTFGIEIARPEGDEFTVIIRHLDSPEQLQVIAERLLHTLSQPFKLGNQSLVITPSIGSVMAPQDGVSPEALIKRADAAMYAAKADGRHRVRAYDATLDRDALKQLELEQDLRRALQDDQLTMVYQPQIATQTGRLVGAEALIRWQHPKLGFIPPTVFIEIAERSGLIIELGNWILQRVNRDVMETPNFPPTISISINLSPIQFNQADFIETLVDRLKEAEAHYTIELELTEGVIMTDASANLSKLKELKSLGFSLAIDDFGTGYSSLSYLRKFPINTLKIDKTFIDDLGTPEGEGIVKAVLGVSDAMSLSVVAEGVETPAQAQFLRDHGCQILQGYLLAKPLAPTELADIAHKDFLPLFDA